MRIEEHKLRHWIDNFYGYGSWNAPFWFIGYEETGGEVPEEVADKVNYFHRHQATREILCDIRQLYQEVGIYEYGAKADKYRNRFDFRFGPEAVQHGVWRNLIRFMHGYRGRKLPDLLKYQQKSFVSASAADAALIPLYPLPSPHGHSWYYSWLDMPSMGFLKSREQYEATVYPHRIKTILNQIIAARPELVLMYGMNNINTLKTSFMEGIPGVKFKGVKAVSRLTPQHHRADVGGTRVIITTQIPALRHNRVETGFDWEEFGRRLNGH